MKQVKDENGRSPPAVVEPSSLLVAEPVSFLPQAPQPQNQNQNNKKLIDKLFLEINAKDEITRNQKQEIEKLKTKLGEEQAKVKINK